MSRTDLALECAEQLDESDLPPKEYQSRTVCRGKVRLTYMDILGESAAQKLGKPCGRYVTAETPSLGESSLSLWEIAEEIAQPLRRLLPSKGTVLVVGLGNDAITPDALGPRSVRRVLATRHIQGEYARTVGLDDLRSVVTVECGVLGKTGMESGELVRGIVQILKPCAVIAIDALAARSVARLGRTVQIGNSGIVPGSGIGNNRKALDEQLLGVPVIAMGVPTVVDAQTLIREMGEGQSADFRQGEQMMVTPREVDTVIRQASELIAAIVNAALQPQYHIEDLLRVTL